ncbi:hypothetical protein JAO74_06085 [Sphingomonas sp. BT553]|uniref:Sporulation protein n=2 Tax=Sphingomonas mollis TaxID=2795726 RepID=A0ABS0XMW8_9SPHN|nr:hypothetical protein [Sphingomonas sp. BT553]MBJ6121358.1 hypothetical protein [Sphingomonas sp. BT553]
MAAKRKPKKQPPRTLGVSLLSAGAAAIGLGAAAVAILFAARKRPNPAEHAAPDLAVDAPPVTIHTRAPEAFRPDPTEPVPADERESLRPATGHAPGFAADRGTTVN